MLTNAQLAEYYSFMHDRVKRGWTQKVLHDEYGRVCLRGAASLAEGDWRLHEELERDMVAGLVEFKPLLQNWVVVPADIEMWNDIPWRRKKTVLRFLAERRDHYQALAREDRILELEETVRHLRAKIIDRDVKIKELQARLEALESENRWLRARREKVTAKQLREASDEMRELERHLEQVHEELTAVKPL